MRLATLHEILLLEGPGTPFTIKFTSWRIQSLVCAQSPLLGGNKVTGYPNLADIPDLVAEAPISVEDINIKINVAAAVMYRR